MRLQEFSLIMSTHIPTWHYCFNDWIQFLIVLSQIYRLDVLGDQRFILAQMMNEASQAQSRATQVQADLNSQGRAYVITQLIMLGVALLIHK